MEKNIKVFRLSVITGILALGMISCESWLDVKPKAEIKSETLFGTEQGFKDALVGVYIGMGDPSAYGKEMTLGFMDVLAQQYEMYTQNGYYNLTNYQYSVAASYIDRMWHKLYNCIANLNNLLQNIDQKKEILHPTNYAIIKGEALGLRAFLHFDILRVWGFGDLKAHPEYLDKYSIPYQTKYNKSVPVQYKEKDILTMIHKDLSEAEELLNAFDPWGIAPKDVDYILPNDDKFYTNRARRFNYMALKATQARVYLWEGNYTKALACAEVVISKQSTHFKWIQDENINVNDQKSKDLSFSTEHVFQLYIQNMYKNFEWNLRLKAADDLNINYNGFYLTKNRADKNFEVPGTGSSDYRYLHHIDNKAGSKWPFMKYSTVEGYKYGDMLALIRVSEMYYIAAECLARSGDAEGLKKAVKYLNTVRSHRGIVNDLAEELTAEQIDAEITKEYMKEFIHEGQLFFYYKRRGETSVAWSSQSMDDKTYRIPFPDVELEFGNREDYRNENKDQ